VVELGERGYGEPMRRVALVTVMCLLSLLVAGLAAARDPRDERVALRQADVALAQRIALKARDLGGAWQRLSVPPAGEGERLTCPGFNPDLSHFTITGQASTAFYQRTGASAVSVVEVFRSRADAVGDFRAAAKPIVVACLKAQLERELRDQVPVDVAVPVARVVPAPRVGERRMAFRIVARVEAGVARISLYLDVVVVQRGRSIAAVFFTSPTRPFARRDRAVVAVATRLR
jgi:hypothetical protein